MYFSFSPWIVVSNLSIQISLSSGTNRACTRHLSYLYFWSLSLSFVLVMPKCITASASKRIRRTLQLENLNYDRLTDKISVVNTPVLLLHRFGWKRLEPVWEMMSLFFSSLENGRSVAAKGPLHWSCRLAEIHEGRVETLGKGVLSGTTVCQWRDHYYRPTSYNVRRICM